MADSNYEIGLNITTQSDDARLKDVVAQLERLNTTTQQLVPQQQAAASAAAEHASMLDRIKESALGVASALGLAFGAVQVINFLKDLFSSGVDAEQELIHLRAVLQAFSPTWKGSAEDVRAWAVELGRATGIGRDETLPAFEKLVAVLGNVDAAMTIVETATKAQKLGWGDLGSSVGAALQLIATGHMRAGMNASIFTRQLKLAFDQTHDLGAAYLILAGQIEKGSQPLDSAATKVGAFKVGWQEAKQAIGAIVSAIADALSPVLIGLSVALGVVVNSADIVIASFKDVVKELYDVGKFAVDVIAGGIFKKSSWQAAWAEFTTDTKRNSADFVTSVTSGMDKMWDGLVSSFTRTGAEALNKGAGQVKAAGKALEDAFKAADAARHPVKDDEAWLALLNKWADEQIRLAKKVADAEEKYINDVREANEKLNADRLRDEQQQEDRVIAAANKITSVEQTLSDRKRMIGAHELANLIKELEDAYAVEFKFGMRSVALEEYIAKLKEVLKQREAAIGEQQSADAIANYAQAASAIFSQNKGLAIASAIVATYAAGVHAMNETPGPIWVQLAALAVALANGFAQVAAIENTNLGSTSVGVGATAPATPMVYTAPTTTTPSPTSSTVINTTNAPATNTTIVVNALDTSNALRSAQRVLRPAERSYNRTIVGRKSTIVGSNRNR
jgi:hypothetical protein